VKGSAAFIGYPVDDGVYMCIHYAYTCVNTYLITLESNQRRLGEVCMSNRIISIILALALLTPMLANLAVLVPVNAQAGIIQAIRGDGPDGNGVYPGGIITVSINVPFASSVTIQVSNANTGEVYATQQFYPPTPGTYDVSVQIPKLLKNIGTSDPPTLLVTVSIPFIGSDQATIYVYPLIEVSPSATTIVDGRGNFKSVSVDIYGLPDGTPVNTIFFNGTSYSVSITADSYGHAGTTIPFSSSFLLPGGLYIVTSDAAVAFSSMTKNATLTILPQVVLSPNEGNGRDVEAISLAGYGFPASANITLVELYNTNFTNVVYVFNITGGLLADANGVFNIADLKTYLATNMTAGLYIPRVTLSSGVKYEFRNTYYLVRPLLCYVSGGVPQCGGPAPMVMPGQTITIVAYGYGPGEEWGHNANFLNVSLDKIVWFATNIPLGKDGNATFNITIPLGTTYGAHYIWGIDIWDYEYSLAVVVGTATYWQALNPVTNQPLPDNKVSATLPGMTTSFIVCPCETVVGTGYCSECTIYGGECQYLGDIIQVTAYGLQPGETVNVYFGDVLVVANAQADNNGALTVKFVVPTLPEGEYVIRLVGSVTGEHIVNFSLNLNDYANPVITPKILLASLTGNYTPVIVGSGIVRVFGTGFTPGVTFAGILVNDTDALLAVTTNVQRWTADSNGVLTSQFTSILGLWIPMVHPGKYAVSLIYVKGTSFYKSLPGYVYVVNNISKLATTDDVSNILNGINDVGKAVNNVANTVSSISSTVGSILSKLDNVATKSDVNAVASKVDTIGSKVDSLSTSISNVVNQLNSITSQLSSAVQGLSTVSSDVSSIKNTVSSIESSISTISSKLDNAATKSDVDAVASKVDNVSSSVSSIQSTLNTVSSKVDTAASKADTASASASNAFYIGIVAVIFALLATVFALLAYLTVRRSIVSK
jgi:predicted  nucleic acid-binding Zn-ribbon protein